MPGAEALAGPVRALVSIHDVMPETLEQVSGLLQSCARINRGPVTLLVVPGRGWDGAGIDRLRAWQDAGHVLAGHGWLHRVERFGGLGHRLHGLFISRRVAEHLALPRDGIAELVRRTHRWFAEHGLGVPDLYVPPAWAMGDLPAGDLTALPFARHEVLTGVLDAASGRLHPVPMVGYEADTAWRAPVIRAWNAYNRRRARSSGWLRIGIHPHDPELRLARDLFRDLADYGDWARYDELPAAPDRARARPGTSRPRPDSPGA